ncbi:MAG: diguanylate cyclase [Clostridia bacterium]|nr:diguanylate cyclase [Clostridia bacterium]
MINTKYVVIIEDNEEVWEMSKRIFAKESKYQIVQVDSSIKSIKDAMLTVPDLVIINEDSLEHIEPVDLIAFFRRTTEHAITPIILVSSNTEKEHKLEMLKKGIEFYIKKPLDDNYFLYTIKNVSRLISANRCISALTGLPGNVQIENELKRRIASRGLYAVLYIDLDNFKAYNDKYGFMNGDEVIKFTSDVIQDTIQKYGKKGDFLGHVGGDDFVAVVDYENAKKIGREVIKVFEEGITKYYTEEDVTKGWIKIPNRKGKLEKYPIMTITVAMISNKLKRYASILEIGEDGASVKKKAKAIPGSTMLEDRRKTRTRTR